MELYQIRYFLALAETLNFTRASERSFISQPALTKAIQRLEEAVGGRLFDRAKTPVQLTELGQAMWPSLRQIYDSAQQARERARRLAHGRRDLVRVGVMCTIDLHQVLPGFAASQWGRPEPDLAEVAGVAGGGGGGGGEIELSFREGNLEALSDALDRGEIDLGLMCSPYELPRRFRALPLYRERYVVAIGDDHRFNGRQEVAVAELHRERYCERALCEFSTYIERLLVERGVALEVVQQSAREDWVQAFVRADFGVAFMPESIAHGARLASVQLSDAPIVREVSVLMPAERTPTRAQQAVIDSLAAHRWLGSPPHR